MHFTLAAQRTKNEYNLPFSNVFFLYYTVIIGTWYVQWNIKFNPVDDLSVQTDRLIGHMINRRTGGVGEKWDHSTNLYELRGWVEWCREWMWQYHLGSPPNSKNQNLHDRRSHAEVGIYKREIFRPKSEIQENRKKTRKTRFRQRKKERKKSWPRKKENKILTKKKKRKQDLEQEKSKIQ